MMMMNKGCLTFFAIRKSNLKIKKYFQVTFKLDLLDNLGIFSFAKSNPKVKK